MKQPKLTLLKWDITYDVNITLPKEIVDYINKIKEPITLEDKISNIVIEACLNKLKKENGC